MHSSDTPKQVPGGPVPQEDEHAICVVPALESAPVGSLDWDRLIETGSTPCLALGAERRIRGRTPN
jgi:hypothetical protein